MPRWPEKKIMSTGVGESQIHRDSDAQDPYAHLRDLHVGGRLVSELPEEVIALLSFDHTDEGISERNAGKSEGVIKITCSELENKIQHRRDDLAAGMQPWEASDPMREVADRHIRPGERPKFLSPAKCAKDGTRGFQVVKDDKGDPVKLGNLVLATMPEDKARQRNEFYREKARTAEGQIKDKFEAQRDRLLSGQSVPSRAVEEFEAGDSTSLSL